MIQLCLQSIQNHSSFFFFYFLHYYVYYYSNQFITLIHNKSSSLKTTYEYDWFLSISSQPVHQWYKQKDIVFMSIYDCLEFKSYTILRSLLFSSNSNTNINTNINNQYPIPSLPSFHFYTIDQSQSITDAQLFHPIYPLVSVYSSSHLFCPEYQSFYKLDEGECVNYFIEQCLKRDDIECFQYFFPYFKQFCSHDTLFFGSKWGSEKIIKYCCDTKSLPVSCWSILISHVYNTNVIKKESQIETQSEKEKNSFYCTLSQHKNITKYILEFICSMIENLETKHTRDEQLLLFSNQFLSYRCYAYLDYYIYIDFHRVQRRRLLKRADFRVEVFLCQLDYYKDCIDLDEWGWRKFLSFIYLPMRFDKSKELKYTQIESCYKEFEERCNLIRNILREKSYCCEDIIRYCIAKYL